MILVGGVGLFLLGMGLLTDGLRQVAGPTLRQMLLASTKTPWRGLLAGLMVTAVVQSSSAVTLATIGFVNAGLIGLSQALWVIFGANVGTTMTGWLVALIGIKFPADAFAFPLIGFGVFLRFLGEKREWTAAGQALAGFGLLFLGIDLLKNGFNDLAQRIALPSGEGQAVLLLQTGVGVLLTVLMQSSSAAMTLVLTAAQGGVLSIQGAAAVVIGANIGTTSTALLAAIGATANAKRTALAHVLFNALTAVLAFLLLPWLIAGLEWWRAVLGWEESPAAQIALFHTLFNVLGVVLIWPLVPRLTDWLSRCFRSAEEDETRPRYLDRTVLAVPELALNALCKESRRVLLIGVAALRQVLSVGDRVQVAHLRGIAQQLAVAIGEFVAQLNRQMLSETMVKRLPQVLRLVRYGATAAELADHAVERWPQVLVSVEPAARAFQAAAGALLAEVEQERGSLLLDSLLAQMEHAFIKRSKKRS